jgi:hypothetical protein
MSEIRSGVPVHVHLAGGVDREHLDDRQQVADDFLRA